MSIYDSKNYSYHNSLCLRITLHTATKHTVNHFKNPKSNIKKKQKQYVFRTTLFQINNVRSIINILHIP